MILLLNLPVKFLKPIMTYIRDYFLGNLQENNFKCRHDEFDGTPEEKKLDDQLLMR